MTDRIDMNRSGYVPPLRPMDVEAMGLALDDKHCDVQHRPGMKAHRHIALPVTAEADETHVSHSCPVCGDVHLTPQPGEVAVG